MALIRSHLGTHDPAIVFTRAQFRITWTGSQYEFQKKILEPGGFRWERVTNLVDAVQILCHMIDANRDRLEGEED